MNRIDRLTAMILMLQSRRVATAEQIASHFEISVRTVYRDIAALGEAGVPILAEAGVGYSLMRGYHMPPVMFTENEIAALFMSSELAEQFGDDSLKKSMRAAMLKVRGALPRERNDYLGRLSNSVNVSGPFSQGEDQSNTSQTANQSEHLMPVQKAVVDRSCLAMHYNTGGRGEINERIVEPLGLLFYSRRWHLIGWCRLRTEIRDFRLDRIEVLQICKETFESRQDFSLVEYLSHEVECEEMTNVSIEVEPWAIDRVLADMPARLVKRSALADGRCQIEALAYSLDWLAGWLLGLGTAAVVVAPGELIEKLRSAAMGVAAAYKE